MFYVTGVYYTYLCVVVCWLSNFVGLATLVNFVGNEEFVENGLGVATYCGGQCEKASCGSRTVGMLYFCTVGGGDWQRKTLFDCVLSPSSKSNFKRRVTNPGFLLYTGFEWCVAPSQCMR